MIADYWLGDHILCLSNSNPNSSEAFNITDF